MNEAEWLYILSGNATVHLTPVEYDSGDANLSLIPRVPHTSPAEEHPVSKGDFIGFPGGLGAQFAHTMVAGKEGVEYLVGGTRSAFDMCVYPL